MFPNHMNGDPLLLPPSRWLTSEWTRGRFSVLMVLLCAWVVIIVGRLAQLMFFPGEQLLTGIQRDAWVEGEISAPRGCILDRAGRPLAWSTRHFSLSWSVPGDAAVAREELAVLTRYGLNSARLDGEQVAALAGRETVLKPDLSSQDMAAVARLRLSITGLDLRSWTARHYWRDPSLQPRLGSLGVTDGREAGMTGEEKRHDELLRGRPGRFRVMVDKDGKWLTGTWQKTADVRPGYDVYLPITVDPLVAANTVAGR